MKFFYKVVLTYQRTRLQLVALVSPQKAAQEAFTLFCRPPRRKRSSKTPAIVEEAATLSLVMNGLNMRGYRWNHPSPKKLLIAHGFGSSAEKFNGFIHPLVKKGYEVIAFDAPAHGRSDGKEITLPVYVQVLRHITNKFGPFNAYIAHSFGGLAVAHLLEITPHDEQTKVVLIAPATETTTAISRFFHLLHLNGKVQQAFNELIISKGETPPEYLSVRRAVQNVKAGILWLHDEQDDTTPYRDAEQVKNDHHPHIQFIISSGLGHRKIYRDPHTLNHILHFL